MKRTISTSSVITAAKESDVVSCDLDGEMALLNIRRGVYHGLNEVGAHIWQLLRQPRRVEEIRDAILREFKVDSAQCEKDVIVVLQQMRDAGLVEVTGG